MQWNLQCKLWYPLIHLGWFFLANVVLFDWSIYFYLFCADVHWHSIGLVKPELMDIPEPFQNQYSLIYSLKCRFNEQECPDLYQHCLFFRTFLSWKCIMEKLNTILFNRIVEWYGSQFDALFNKFLLEYSSLSRYKQDAISNFITNRFSRAQPN